MFIKTYYGPHHYSVLEDLKTSIINIGLISMLVYCVTASFLIAVGAYCP